MQNTCKSLYVYCIVFCSRYNVIECLTCIFVECRLKSRSDRSVLACYNTYFRFSIVQIVR